MKMKKLYKIILALLFLLMLPLLCSCDEDLLPSDEPETFRVEVPKWLSGDWDTDSQKLGLISFGKVLRNGIWYQAIKYGNPQTDIVTEFMKKHGKTGWTIQHIITVKNKYTLILRASDYLELEFAKISNYEVKLTITFRPSGEATQVYTVKLTQPEPVDPPQTPSEPDLY